MIYFTYDSIRRVGRGVCATSCHFGEALSQALPACYSGTHNPQASASILAWKLKMGSPKSRGRFYRALVTCVLINTDALLVSTVTVGNETSLVKMVH